MCLEIKERRKALGVSLDELAAALGPGFAEPVGFQRGDVVLAVNNTKIAKTRDLEKVAQAGARVWRVIIQRGGQQISATFGG